MADAPAPASPGPTPPPQDGGPIPPSNPVQPGSGNPATDPATNPSAPVNAPEGDGPTPEVDQFAEAREAMGDTSPTNFLAGLFEDQGVDLTPASPPPATPPAAPAAPPVQPPVGNGAPTPPSTPPALVAPGGVDPALLQQVLNPAPQPPAPAPYPVQPQPAPAAQAPAPTPAQPTEFVPFPQGFHIPEQVHAALEHDDPSTRRQALAATIAAAGNQTAQQVLNHIVQNVLPHMAAATVTTVRQTQQQERMMEDILDGAPQLRFASPQLIEQCTTVVKRDELARNPGAVWTKEIGRKVRDLAVSALQSMASGQMPQFAPPQGQLPPQYAPQAPAPMPQAPGPAVYAVSQPEQGQDGRWYVKLNTGQWAPTNPPAAYTPPQAPIPFVSSTPAGSFGIPAPQVPTPASEVADFMANGGW